MNTCNTCKYEDLTKEQMPCYECRGYAKWEAKETDLPKMTPANRGSLVVSAHLLQKHPETVATLFGLLRFVPTYVSGQEGSAILYIGMSPHFAPIGFEDPLPRYEATVTDGRVSVRKDEAK